VGIATGTAMAAAVDLAPTYPLAFLGHTFPGYIALYTLILNLVIAVVLTPLFRSMRAAQPPTDQTVTSDYFA